MEKFIAKELELKEMEVIDSFNEADNNKWFEYVSILTYRYYGIEGYDEDTMWFSKLYDFWHRYVAGCIKCKFSIVTYLKDDRYSEMRKTIKAFGLDIEQFWYLLLFIYDYVSEKLSNGNTITNTSKTIFAQDLMKQIGDSDVEDVEIIIKNKGKKIPISNIGKMSIITMLLEGYKKLYKDAYGYDFNFPGSNNIKAFSLSYHMAMAVDMLEYTFNHIDKEWNMIHPDKSAGASLNKMLLYSQIMHLYRWTENENFLYDDSSLKGVLKIYKKKLKNLPEMVSNSYW